MSNNTICIPSKGRPAQEVLSYLQDSREKDAKWQNGKAFCLVYYPGDARSKVIKEAYNLFFSENALNPTAFPSLQKLENEVVAMSAALFHGTKQTCGSMTSGGTESISLAVKTARDFARAERPEISHPEIIVPKSVHPAFQKAFHYFGVKGVEVEVDDSFRVSTEGVRKAISPKTIMLVGSAPSYPHGVVDPIEDLSEIALENNLLLHVDACIGGFILPFLAKMEVPIPAFDFALPGVTSISADLHKYAYAAKGASVILYKNHKLRKSQFYVYTEWSGGIYASSTMLGTRPGGAIAAAWTALQTIGEEGYLEMAKSTWETTQDIKKAIEAIPELQLIGEPEATILAFGSDTLDIYALADELNLLGWHFDRQQAPACIHLTVTYAQTGKSKAFIRDLKQAVKKVKKLSVNKITTSFVVSAFKGLQSTLPPRLFSRLNQKLSDISPANSKRKAAMYGLMGSLSGSGDLKKMILNLLDKLYSVKE